MKKMRIATTVTGQFTTPPPKGVIYAPMDIAVEVGRGLVQRGHEVTFFAPEGSRAEGLKIETAGLKALKQDGGGILKLPNVGGAETSKLFNLWDQFIIAEMYRRAIAGEFDILHIHPVDRALPMAYAIRSVPTVYTLHDPIYQWRGEIFKMFASPNQYYVSISDSQRAPAPDLNYLATVYNGVAVENVPFSEKPGDYLLFVGRLIPEKGVSQAIEVAKKTGHKLLIIGTPDEGSYWEKDIKPNLSDSIQYVGEIPREKLSSYYRDAKATLVPIQWEEPFGLVMAESMATGTPVLAMRRGSAPEIVEHGITGFVVDTVDQMAEAVAHIGEIDRRACRARIEKKFSTSSMVEGYERAFEKLLSTFSSGKI